uniref:Uncharacterized conserved protein n=1 Tax=Candidatus Kentrum sp. DK TaxID=2126562 RepID=A0A450TJV6_9GAMM|nr:MAG: Uncharacterized conserved protein [Candidatus Kentron sp. DK]VFJ68355.1 MAG: Uncharacterized conserved protein [Candidatus Kentron sp. DK]
MNKTKVDNTADARKLIRNSTVQFLIFTGQRGEQSIEARYDGETIWLTQKLMATLFDVTVPTINEHLKNIYDTDEISREATIRKFRTAQTEGNRKVAREIDFYNLDAIISVGYRVNSVRATQFRQWATGVLREFAIKGYILDKQRMENGSFLGEDYFERLLEEIREIRLSERRFYQKITDIYATSVDYNKDAPTTRHFFAQVQNKLHFAIHGYTAAELIKKRADSRKEHMGLTTWRNGPDGKILKSDVSVAKNYLEKKPHAKVGSCFITRRKLTRKRSLYGINEHFEEAFNAVRGCEATFAYSSKEELESLGRIINAYLDLAEERAKRKVPMTMEDWAKRLDLFLEFDEREILQDKGRISAELARAHAESEFEKYRIMQDRSFESDFDKVLKDAFST